MPNWLQAVMTLITRGFVARTQALGYGRARTAAAGGQLRPMTETDETTRA